MRYSIQNLDEITDSREVLAAKPHPFTIIFIYITIAILFSAIVWAYFSDKEIVVNANGVVRPEKGVTKISNKATGKIVTVNYKDGDTVKEGQVLYTIEHESLDLQKTVYETNLKNLNDELNNLTKFKESIASGKNLFDEKIDTEKNYYNKFNKFQQDSSNITNQLKSTQVQIQDLRNTLSNYTLLQKSVNDNCNNFNESSSFYNQYLDYQMSLKQYQSKIDQAQSALNTVKSTANVQQSQIDSANSVLEGCNQDLDKYKNQYASSIKSNIEQSQQKLTELQSSPTIAQENSNQYTTKDAYKLDTTIQTEDSIKSTKAKIDEANANIKNLNISINDCIVKADNDGVINSLTKINIGDLLQGGSEIATILPKKVSNFAVDVYINNKDIGNIENGQKINLNLQALPYKEYGSVKTKIQDISSDSKASSKGASYYSALANIDKKYLYSHKGKKAEIKSGMVCNIEIVSHKEKMLYYLLEKLDLKN